MNEPTHLDLCSGIGGFSLAFESAGFQTIAFSEVEPYASAVLRKHWPGVPNLGDLKNITNEMVDDAVSLCYEFGMNNLDSRYDEAVPLYNKGLSIGAVAEFFGVTRQAMWKILIRRGVQMRPMRRHGIKNHFYRGGPKSEKRAHRLLETAVRNGVVIPRGCEVCGKEASGHHDDYNKPLDVRWLCKQHHFEWHEKNTAQTLNSTLPKMSKEEICSLGGKASAHKRHEQRTEGTRRPDRRIDVLTAGVP